MCLSCSGNHRNLGSQISYVKSADLDAIRLEELLRMEVGGNRRAASYFTENIENGTRVDYRSSKAEKYRALIDADVNALLTEFLPNVKVCSPAMAPVPGSNHSGTKSTSTTRPALAKTTARSGSHRTEARAKVQAQAQAQAQQPRIRGPTVVAGPLSGPSTNSTISHSSSLSQEAAANAIVAEDEFDFDAAFESAAGDSLSGAAAANCGTADTGAIGDARHSGIIGIDLVGTTGMSAQDNRDVGGRIGLSADEDDEDADDFFDTVPELRSDVPTGGLRDTSAFSARLGGSGLGAGLGSGSGSGVGSGVPGSLATGYRDGGVSGSGFRVAGGAEPGSSRSGTYTVGNYKVPKKDLSKAKAISCDDFADDDDEADDAFQLDGTYARFKGAQGISSDQYFGREAASSGSAVNTAGSIEATADESWMDPQTVARVNVLKNQLVYAAGEAAVAAQERLKNAATWFSRISSL